MHFSRKQRWVFGLSVPIITIVIVGLFMWRQQPKQLVPETIMRSATYDLYVPLSNKVTYTPSKMTYDKTLDIVSFNASQRVPATTLVFTEQARPSSEQVDLQSILKNTGSTHTFQIALGDVNIFDGTVKNSGKRGVLITDTTMIFVSSSKELNDAAWKDLLSTLSPVTGGTRTTSSGATSHY